MDTAVTSFEYVVSQDPTYKNSLTYLGRAYYRKERYKDAYAICSGPWRSTKTTRSPGLPWGDRVAFGTKRKRHRNPQGGVTLASKVLVEVTKTMSAGTSGESSGLPSDAVFI